MTEVGGTELAVPANLSTQKCYKRRIGTRYIVTNEKVRASIMSFGHFKPSDIDGIYLTMLQKEIANLACATYLVLGKRLK